MKNFKPILTALLFVSGSMAQAAPIDYKCPTMDVIKKDNTSREAMYAPMVAGVSDVYSRIVFVDEDDKGNKEVHKTYGEFNTTLGYGELNKQLFGSADSAIYGSHDAGFDHSGEFKIGYRYNATECRRQIILGKQNLDSKTQDPLGTYNGWTAIDICNPGIMNLFAAAKLTRGSGNMQTIDDLLAFAEATNKQDKSVVSDALLMQLNKNLKLSSKQAEAVRYFTDKDGDIVPRFSVKIKALHYRQYGTACSMRIDHDDRANNYAGLMSSYSSDYSWELTMSPDPTIPSTQTLWYWDLDVYQPGDKTGVTYNYVQVRMEN